MEGDYLNFRKNSGYFEIKSWLKIWEGLELLELLNDFITEIKLIPS
jgi:hypothetical protein